MRMPAWLSTKSSVLLTAPPSRPSATTHRTVNRMICICILLTRLVLHPRDTLEGALLKSSRTGFIRIVSRTLDNFGGCVATAQNRNVPCAADLRDSQIEARYGPFPEWSQILQT